MTWDEVIGRMKMDETFNSEVAQALKIYDGGARTWMEEGFTDNGSTGYRIEKSTIFYSADELKAKYDISIKDLEGSTVTIQNELGEAMEGVIVEGVEPRKVIYYVDIWTQYLQNVHNASTALRPGQGKEVCEQYRKEIRKVPAFKNLFTPKALQEKVELIHTARNAEVARSQMMAADAPPQAVETEEAQAGALSAAAPDDKEGESSDAFEQLGPDHDEAMEGVFGPSAASRPTEKGKKKEKKKCAERGKGRAGGSARGRGAGSKAESARRSTATASNGPASEGGKPASETSGSTAKATEATPGSLQRYREELKIGEYLGGNLKLGQKQFQATRHLNSCRNKLGKTVEFALLAAHLEEFKKATCLVEDKLAKLNPATRRQYIKDLHHYGVKFPKHIQTSLILQEAEVATETSILHLCAPPTAESSSEFDPTNPVLAAAALGDTDTGRTMTRALASTYLPAGWSTDTVSLARDSQYLQGLALHSC